MILKIRLVCQWQNENYVPLEDKLMVEVEATLLCLVSNCPPRDLQYSAANKPLVFACPQCHWPFMCWLSLGRVVTQGCVSYSAPTPPAPAPAPAPLPVRGVLDALLPFLKEAHARPRALTAEHFPEPSRRQGGSQVALKVLDGLD